MSGSPESGRHSQVRGYHGSSEEPRDSRAAGRGEASLPLTAGEGRKLQPRRRRNVGARGVGL